MDHPLGDAREMLASSLEDIHRFEREVQDFLNGIPGHVDISPLGPLGIPAPGPDGIITGSLRIETPHPLGASTERKWGITVGEICGKVRSALDYAVYQLSEHDQDGGVGPEDPNVHTQFPIYTSAVGYFRGKNGGKGARDKNLAGVSEAHKKVIDRFQPFQRGSVAQADRDPLTVLNWLDNRKKHRLIHTAVLGRGGSAEHIHVEAVDPPVLSYQFQLKIERDWEFKDGAVVFQLRMPPEVKEVQVSVRRAIWQLEGFFGERRVSFQRLKVVHQHVNSIITSLDPLFR